MTDNSKFNSFSRFYNWLTVEKKTILSEIIVNFFDKLFFALIAAILAFIFNSMLGSQEIVGDYQKEIYIQRQNGYLEIFNELKTVERTVGDYLDLSLDDSYSNQIRFNFNQLKYYTSTGNNFSDENSGITKYRELFHQESLNKVLNELDNLISIVGENEIYFPKNFLTQVDEYMNFLIQNIRNNEENLKRLSIQKLNSNANVEDKETVLTEEDILTKQEAFFDELVQLGNKIDTLIRNRLKIEGLVLG